MGGPLGWIAEAGDVIGDILGLLGIGEFLPSNLLIDCLSSLFCHEGEVTQGICTSILFVLCGYDATHQTITQPIVHETRTHSVQAVTQAHHTPVHAVRQVPVAVAQPAVAAVAAPAVAHAAYAAA